MATYLVRVEEKDPQKRGALTQGNDGLLVAADSFEDARKKAINIYRRKGHGVIIKSVSFTYD